MSQFIIVNVKIATPPVGSDKTRKTMFGSHPEQCDMIGILGTETNGILGDVQ